MFFITNESSVYVTYPSFNELDSIINGRINFNS